ncbi:hypothetical protein N24_0473 [Corynebacterium suranareeae]|uniref:Uncharacterized protein n=1 Tax=Corynebacterium suranareeae TaxID=2506452 RepID=A0A160PNA0_9CORY|nr:hypothetical protein N24_0473 [Corynebacterium suranareeae]
MFRYAKHHTQDRSCSFRNPLDPVRRIFAYWIFHRDEAFVPALIRHVRTIRKFKGLRFLHNTSKLG